MAQGGGAGAAVHGVAVEAANTAADAVQEVAAVGGAGDVAPAAAGSVAAAADLVEQGVAGSDSVVPDLVVTVSRSALDAGAEASDKQVVDVKEDLVGNKRKWDSSGYYPYDSDEDEPYEYESGDDVVEGNIESFKEKEELKIRAQGPAKYYNLMNRKYRCPYCSKPKPRSGLLEHLMEHCRATSMSSHDYKIIGQHSALLKVLRNPDH
ncbi:hypothetical protein VPH35_112695 [Triticum aestivum]